MNREKKANVSQQGFTLLELIVVLAIAVTIFAMATPSYIRWRESVEYRTSAGNIAAVLREARSRTIVSNLQHRVEFEMSVPPAPPGPTGRYRMTRGERAANSQTWITVIQDWTAIPVSVTLSLIDLTANPGNNSIDFNTSGTANIANLATAATITVRERTGTPRYTIEVSNVGRIRIL